LFQPRKPGELKKPDSPFFIFMKENRHKIKDLRMKMVEITKFFGALWQDMPETEKQKYKDRNLQEMEIYRSYKEQ
jgi:hypothetical protein